LRIWFRTEARRNYTAKCILAQVLLGNLRLVFLVGFYFFVLTQKSNKKGQGLHQFTKKNNCAGKKRTWRYRWSFFSSVSLSAPSIVEPLAFKQRFFAFGHALFFS